MMERLLPAKGPGEAGAQPLAACRHGCSHRFCGCRDLLISKAVGAGLASTDDPGRAVGLGHCRPAGALRRWPSASPFEMARDAKSLQQPSSEKELVASSGA